MFFLCCSTAQFFPYHRTGYPVNEVLDGHPIPFRSEIFAKHYVSPHRVQNSNTLVNNPIEAVSVSGRGSNTFGFNVLGKGETR